MVQTATRLLLVLGMSTSLTMACKTPVPSDQPKGAELTSLGSAASADATLLTGWVFATADGAAYDRFAPQSITPGMDGAVAPLYRMQLTYREESGSAPQRFLDLSLHELIDPEQQFFEWRNGRAPVPEPENLEFAPEASRMLEFELSRDGVVQSGQLGYIAELVERSTGREWLLEVVLDATPRATLKTAQRAEISLDERDLLVFDLAIPSQDLLTQARRSLSFDWFSGPDSPDMDEILLRVESKEFDLFGRDLDHEFIVDIDADLRYLHPEQKGDLYARFADAASFLKRQQQGQQPLGGAADYAYRLLLDPQKRVFAAVAIVEAEQADAAAGAEPCSYALLHRLNQPGRYQLVDSLCLE